MIYGIIYKYTSPKGGIYIGQPIVLKNKKPKQFDLTNKYFIFLGKRTKLEEKDIYKLSFENNAVIV